MDTNCSPGAITVTTRRSLMFSLASHQSMLQRICEYGELPSWRKASYIRRTHGRVLFNSSTVGGGRE